MLATGVRGCMSRKFITSVALVIGVLVATKGPIAGGADLRSAYSERGRIALRLWEIERTEFIAETTLNAREKQSLIGELTSTRVYEPDERKGLELLVALNCGNLPPDKTRYYQLERYRCADYPFDDLARSAASSIGGLYVLAFSKPGDRARVVAFLDRYITFWEREVRLGHQGIAISTPNREVLLELVEFLKAGGYPEAKR